MEVSPTFPPMYAEIAKRFPVTARTVFAWGDTIYNPGGIEIPEDLMAHEEVHSRQQKEMGGPKVWWDLYLTDTSFVVRQEAQAYGRQFSVICARVRDRNVRFKRLRELAQHFSGPLYGNAIDFDEAMKLIKQYSQQAQRY